MLKKTTDLALIEIGYPFVFGEVIKIHKIGDFALVEAGQDVMFYVYTNGKEAGYKYDNLDHAIAAAISFKYECSVNAAGYFMKSIGAC
jgi:hypothetical protein